MHSLFLRLARAFSASWRSTASSAEAAGRPILHRFPGNQHSTDMHRMKPGLLHFLTSSTASYQLNKAEFLLKLIAVIFMQITEVRKNKVSLSPISRPSREWVSVPKLLLQRRWGLCCWSKTIMGQHREPMTINTTGATVFWKQRVRRQ